jgi:hypothetical protein
VRSAFQEPQQVLCRDGIQTFSAVVPTKEVLVLFPSNMSLSTASILSAP